MQTYKTAQRRAFLDYLAAHPDEPMSARQIAEALSAKDVSVSAVYRNLASLEAEGAVKRLTKEGCRTVYYRYTGAEDCKHHLHLSCVDCGKTFHMPESVSDALIRSVADGAHFSVDSAGTVLYGVCENCKRRRP